MYCRIDCTAKGIGTRGSLTLSLHLVQLGCHDDSWDKEGINREVSQVTTVVTGVSLSLQCQAVPMIREHKILVIIRGHSQ